MALEEQRTGEEEDGELVAATLNNLAMTYNRQGNHQQAVDTFNECIKVFWPKLRFSSILYTDCFGLYLLAHKISQNIIQSTIFIISLCISRETGGMYIYYLQVITSNYVHQTSLTQVNSFNFKIIQVENFVR